MADTETLTDPNLPADSVQAAPGATNGTLTDWRGSLPDDLRSEKALADFKDVGSLAKSYVETKRMVGDAVRVPGKDAKPEEVTAFHRKLGVPESPDKYDVKLPEVPKDHPAWEPTVVAGFKGVAHQAGLTPAQVQAVVDWYAKDSVQSRGLASIEGTRAAQAEQAKALETLQAEWGQKDSLGWQQKADLAQRVVRTFARGDTQARMLEQLQFKASDPIDPEAAMFLARIGEATQEHIYVGDDRPLEGEDQDVLAQKIDEIRRELDTMNQGHPRRAELMAQQHRLYQRKHGGRPL